MVQHIWKRLDTFPLVFTVVFAIGIFVPCIIALSNGHVTPYIPYISEGGGKFPEAGIFSFCISFSAFVCQNIIILRYLVVEELNTVIGNYSTGFLNKIGLVLGGLSTFSLLIVASYPTSTISQVHNSAAGITCVCFLVYLICHTLISFRIMGRTKMAYFRLVITIFCGISLVLISAFGLIASSMWTAEYWSGLKKPGDKGFQYYVVSSCSEWIMAFIVVLFFTTFIFEFKKSAFHFQLEITATKKKPTLSNLDIRHR